MAQPASPQVPDRLVGRLGQPLAATRGQHQSARRTVRQDRRPEAAAAWRRVLPSPRHRYSEAAHIRAREDGGPDLTENLLCLCPNCHVRFDGGAYVLTDDLTIIDTVKDRLGVKLKRHQWHYINSDHVRHHRLHWTSRNPAPLTALPSAQQSN
ncbi:HNH endonuclease [Streptomyces xiangluensis]|uniref:HNH endonuclease n=1 Tax=Streptomyces xiangluensis TaxID=2665720 RepID=A0ABV8YIP7_9ACTN